MNFNATEQTSKIMSAIRSQNTKPEIKLRKALFKLGLRYRVQYKITGKPDVVFAGKKLAIFVDGCFWHGCPECYREPSKNKGYWQNKVAKNKARDDKVNVLLAEQGWSVLRFWEHEILSETVRVVDKIKDIVRPEAAS